MYGFMRGSHLLVRCPKWTPLSSRAFMEITAIGKNLLAFGLRSHHPRQRPRSFDPWHALEGPRACEIGIYVAYPRAGYVALSRHGRIITYKNGLAPRAKPESGTGRGSDSRLFLQPIKSPEFSSGQFAK